VHKLVLVIAAAGRWQLRLLLAAPYRIAQDSLRWISKRQLLRLDVVFEAPVQQQLVAPRLLPPERLTDEREAQQPPTTRAAAAPPSEADQRLFAEQQRRQAEAIRRQQQEEERSRREEEQRRKQQEEARRRQQMQEEAQRKRREEAQRKRQQEEAQRRRQQEQQQQEEQRRRQQQEEADRDAPPPLMNTVRIPTVPPDYTKPPPLPWQASFDQMGGACVLTVKMVASLEALNLVLYPLGLAWHRCFKLAWDHFWAPNWLLTALFAVGIHLLGSDAHTIPSTYTAHVAFWLAGGGLSGAFWASLCLFLQLLAVIELSFPPDTYRRVYLTFLFARALPRRLELQFVCMVIPLSVMYSAGWLSGNPALERPLNGFWRGGPGAKGEGEGAGAGNKAARRKAAVEQVRDVDFLSGLTALPVPRGCTNPDVRRVLIAEDFYQVRAVVCGGIGVGVGVGCVGWVAFTRVVSPGGWSGC